MNMSVSADVFNIFIKSVMNTLTTENSRFCFLSVAKSAVSLLFVRHAILYSSLIENRTCSCYNSYTVV